LDLVLYKAVNVGRIYVTSEFEMYCVRLKKYVLCTNVRVDLSSDKGSQGLNVWVVTCLRVNYLVIKCQ